MDYFDPNTVFFGLSNLHIAPFSDTSTATDPVWSDSIIAIPGAVNFGPTANNSEMNFFADNIKYFTTFQNNGFTGTLEVAKIPVEFLKAIFRYVVDDNGILISTAGVGYRNYAIMFEVQGNIAPVRMIWYNCSSGLPTIPYQTMEENSDPSTQSMDISVSPIRFSDGTTATFAQCPMNPDSPETKVIYENWFKEAYHPSISTGIDGAMYQPTGMGFK